MSKYIFKVGGVSKEVPYSEQQITIDIENATSNIYQLYAVDSRGNSKIIEKTATQFIEYEPLKIDVNNSYVERDDGGTGENVSLKYQGNIWNSSFGSVSNTII